MPKGSGIEVPGMRRDYIQVKKALQSGDYKAFYVPRAGNEIIISLGTYIQSEVSRSGLLNNERRFSHSIHNFLFAKGKYGSSNYNYSL